MFLQTEGRLEVLGDADRGGGDSTAARNARRFRRKRAAAPVDDDPEQREKVIVRSNGVVTYVGKDIANQFWKFGLLGRDFYYRVFDVQANGQPFWANDHAWRRTGRRRHSP